MNDTKVFQENIEADEVAGRDIIKNTTNYNFNNLVPGSEYMARLIEKLKIEKQSNTIFQEKLNELIHYSTHVDREELIGLKKKLEAGNRSHELFFAQDTKERIFQKIKKNEHYESAQEIYAYILSEIYSRFYNHIYPAIVNGKSIDEVNQLVGKYIIEPIQNILGENILRIMRDDINGMLYFLTDNCHIKWN